MKKITLDSFFEALRRLDENNPNGFCDIDEKDGAIQIRRWEEYRAHCFILDGYSNKDFERLYYDIEKKIKEHNWTYITCKKCPGCFEDSYSGHSLLIAIEEKRIIISMNNSELTMKINP